MIRSIITYAMVASASVLIFAEINFRTAIATASIAGSDGEIQAVMATFGFEVTGTPADTFTFTDKLNAIRL